MTSVPWQTVSEDELVHGIRRRIVTGEETDEIDAFRPIRTDWLDGSDAYLRGER